MSKGLLGKVGKAITGAVAVGGLAGVLNGAVKVGTEVSYVGNNMYNVKVTADSRDADVSDKLFIGTDQAVNVPSALVPYLQFVEYNAPLQQNDFFGDFPDGTFNMLHVTPNVVTFGRAIMSFDNLPAPQSRKAELGTITFNAPNGLPAGTYNFYLSTSNFTELENFLNGGDGGYKLSYGNVINDYNQQFTVHMGDVNYDGAFNNQDIAPFVALLTGVGNSSVLIRGDMNYDGVVNNQDIAPFVTALVGSGGSLGDSGLDGLLDRNVSYSAPAIPEPSTLGLIGLGAGVMAYRGSRGNRRKEERVSERR